MEERKNIISYREVVDTVSFEINPTDEEYSEVLTCLFNNKRDNREEILDLWNYWGSNSITIKINMTKYAEDFESEDQAIDHIKNWLNNFMRDNDVNNIIVTHGKAAIYHIDEYGSKIPYEENGEYITNYYTED